MWKKFKPWLRQRIHIGYFFVAALIGFMLVFGHEYSLVVNEEISSWSKDPIADCAVVLTGGAGRIREGFSLLSRKLVKKLLISGVNPDVEFQNIYPARVLMGDVNEQDIILEKKSTTTFGNAQHTLSLTKELRCQNLVIVTSQYHMPRAYKTFVSAFPQGYPLFKHALIASRPESSTLEIWTEVLKNVFYSLWAY